LSLPITALRGYPFTIPLSKVEARNRSIRRRVNAAWGLLFFNTLTYTAGSVLDLPSKIGKGMAQASLPLAILILLTINPKLKVRPNVFLCIVSLLIVDTVLTAAQVHHLGIIYRTGRLIEFVAALWLLTPWWGREDLMLLRIHLRWLYIALGSAFLGMLIAPGKAFAFEGRLEGVIWPMTATQLAQYGAVTTGFTVILWLGRRVSGRAAIAGVSFAVLILLLTHTRTALLALVAGILVAGLSLFIVNARVRKFFASLAVVVSIGVTTAAGVISTWLARGENAQGLTSLTGRTNFWALVLNEPRSFLQDIFGFGLSNSTVNGKPIDSNWLVAYQMEGLYGVTVCAMMLIFLAIAAFFQSPGVRRALIFFIVTYCTVASLTEDASADVSTYLLHLVVAGSLLR
jgi:hypothetical protein